MTRQEGVAEGPGSLLAQNASQNLFEPAPILFARTPEVPHNEVLGDRRDDRLHHGDLQETSFTPPREPDLPERGCRPDLTYGWKMTRVTEATIVPCGTRSQQTCP